MAIDYTTLFTRLGAIVGRVNEYLALQSSATISLMGSGKGVDKILDQYTDVTTSRRDLVVGLQEKFDPGYVTQVQGWIADLNTYAATLLGDLQRELNTSSTGSDDILTALYWRMLEDEETILASVVSAPTVAVPAGADVNDGTGKILCGTMNPVTGTTDERIISEVVKAICITDSYSGGTLAGSEIFQLIGYPTWPTASYQTRGNGEGSSNVTVASAGELTPTSPNILPYGSFETWAGSPLAPTGWTIDGGIAATHIVRSATAYTGTYAASIVSDSTLTPIGISQVVGGLTPNTIYCLGFWMRKKAAAAGGTFTVKVVCGGVTTNAFSANPSTLNETYTAYSAFFRTNEETTTATITIVWTDADAPTAADAVYIDAMTVAPAVAFGNAWYAAIRGNSDFIINDLFRITLANNYAGKFQTYLGRFFAAMLPSAASPSNTIDDTLVV